VKKTEVLEDLSVDLRITLKLRIRFSGMWQFNLYVAYLTTLYLDKQ
jgi:hypothetical protein